MFVFDQVLNPEDWFSVLPVHNHMDHFSQELGLEDKDEMPINHLSDFQYEQTCEENSSLDIILYNQVSHKPGCAATTRQRFDKQTICSI